MIKQKAKTKTSLQAQLQSQLLKSLRRFQGVLVGKGPKDVVAWQRRSRRDRSPT